MMVYVLMQWAPGQFHIVNLYKTSEDAMASTGHNHSWWEPQKNTHGHREWTCKLPSPICLTYVVQEWAVRS